MNNHIIFTLFIIILAAGFKQSLTDTTLSKEHTVTSKDAAPDYLNMMELSINKGEHPNFHSVLVAQNNQIIYEQYFAGKDELWGKDLGVINHSHDTLHDIRSISKSVVSTCIGLAIQQGKIKNVEQNIFDFFPEYQQHKTGTKAQLTLKHLLTMTSGLAWNEEVPYTDPENSEIQMTSSKDPIEYILTRPIVTEPGKSWNYNGGTTQLLAEIIKRTTGLQIDEFANQHLLKPLGIHDYSWSTFPQTSNPAAASGLRLKSRDLMKFGMLYANKGNWHGKQLLTESWVEASTTPHIRFGRNNVGYGYQFWLLSADSMLKDQN